jgi:thiosulfate/3-mercaptopyruvate sulfurtransferase
VDQLLVSTAWLANHLDDPNVRIVDARWYLLEPGKGEKDYAGAHIPNAIYLSVDNHLAAPPLSDAKTGRHPLPSPEAFAATMRRAGISNGDTGAQTHVVAYDDAGGANSARLWWLLRYFGHENVSLLDGGLIQWLAEGRLVSNKVPTFPGGDFHARPNRGMVITKEEMIELTRDPRALILDSRAPERYRGDTEPIDPRAGHIPGAKNATLPGNRRSPDDFRFRNPSELQAHYDALGANGADEIVAYCGSGINAAATIFALQLAGYAEARLYPGSFSEWSRDAALPVISGDTPY